MHFTGSYQLLLLISAAALASAQDKPSVKLCTSKDLTRDCQIIDWPALNNGDDARTSGQSGCIPIPKEADRYGDKGSSMGITGNDTSPFMKCTFFESKECDPGKKMLTHPHWYFEPGIMEWKHDWKWKAFHCSFFVDPEGFLVASSMGAAVVAAAGAAANAG